MPMKERINRLTNAMTPPPALPPIRWPNPDGGVRLDGKVLTWDEYDALHPGAPSVREMWVHSHQSPK